MKDVFVVGIDPGFAKCGVAIVEILPSYEVVHALEIITTEKIDRKRNVRASHDNVRRAKEITRGLLDLIPRGTIAICSEAQSMVRQASDFKIGIFWGVLAATAEFNALPILQATPQEIKKRLCGRGSASKKEVQAKLVERYERLPLPSQKGKHEHICDALGAVVTCLDAPEIMMARRMIA